MSIKAWYIFLTNFQSGRACVMLAFIYKCLYTFNELGTKSNTQAKCVLNAGLVNLINFQCGRACDLLA